jgi:hypothetical protein
MRRFKKGEIPKLDFKKAVKKPIPVRVAEIKEPFEVETLEGAFKAKAGDFLIVGPRNEMWAIDREIFLETYDFIN